MAVQTTLGVDRYMGQVSALGVPVDAAAAVLLLCMVREIHKVLEEDLGREVADITLDRSIRSAHLALLSGTS